MSTNPKRKENRETEEKKIAKRLQGVTAPLQKEQESFGVKESFRHVVQESSEAALALCERAMEDLSTHYVTSLTEFKEASDPLSALSFLEKSEEIWRKGAQVIEQFDADGNEVLFLKKMRTMSFDVLQSKLESMEAENLSIQHQALSLGILGVQNTMLEELGFTHDCPERLALKEKAKKFS